LPPTVPLRVHAIRCVLPVLHDSPPFGVTTTSAPVTMRNVLLLVSQTEGVAVLHTRMRAAVVAGPVTSQF
jgi:hypothetical protein